jgi:hypothetical protein
MPAPARIASVTAIPQGAPMKKTKRKTRPRRKAVLKKHMTVGAALKLVSAMLAIPRQAILMVGRNRRKASTRAKLAQLREEWKLGSRRR